MRSLRLLKPSFREHLDYLYRQITLLGTGGLLTLLAAAFPGWPVEAGFRLTPEAVSGIAGGRERSKVREF